MEFKKYKLITGTDDFKKLISSNGLTVDPEYLFVDKTLLIKDFLENGAEVLLITRPRRWGKSLALSMLRYFLTKEVDGQPTASLFENLKISKYLQENPELKKYQGQHPVILINLKDLKGNSFEEIEKKIVEKLSDLFSSYQYLLVGLKNRNTSFNFDEVNFQNKIEMFSSIIMKKGNIELLERSLFFLSELLYKYHGKKVFVLIDEYDNAINNSYDQPKVVSRLTDFFGNMFGACLKSNPYLEKGLITGVLRIAKAGMFSGLNNLIEITMLDSRFNDCYGFTEQETFDIVSNTGLSTTDVKNWYNGYLIGSQKMYNPWSITQFISNNGELRPYWVDTANPRMLRNILLDNSISEERIKISDLLQKNELLLTNEISSIISMEDLKFNVEAMWTLMLHAGYLTLVETNNYFKVRLPNYEIRKLIEKDINNWFTENKIFSNAANALLSGNFEGFREALEVALANPIYNTRIFNNKAASSKQNLDLKEFMYQFLVMAELRCINLGVTKNYEIIAEPQKISLGLTRPDFIVLNHKEKFCIVGEIKIVSRKETLEEAVDRAMIQINKNQYGQKYQNAGYKLIKVGIAFQGLEFEIIWEE